VGARGSVRERRIRFPLDEKSGNRHAQAARFLQDEEREAAFTGDEAEPLGETLSRCRLSRA
jgi:hypothetical protein